MFQPVTSILCIVINTLAGWKATSKFLIPGISLAGLNGISSRFLMFNFYHTKESGPCECEVCKAASDVLKHPVQYRRESIAFIDLAIRYSSIPSLKNVCMAKVVELGLDQDCLPVSVQETIKKGPEVGEVDRRTQWGLEMLEKIRKECNH